MPILCLICEDTVAFNQFVIMGAKHGVSPRITTQSLGWAWNKLLPLLLLLQLLPSSSSVVVVVVVVVVVG